jgi:hypothetical protein
MMKENQSASFGLKKDNKIDSYLIYLIVINFQLFKNINLFD